MGDDIMALPIRNGLRLRDLPEDFRRAFTPFLGGLPKVSFRNGTFFKVIWVNIHPLSDPERIEIPLDEDDALVIDKDWGVDGRMLGGLRK